MRKSDYNIISPYQTIVDIDMQSIMRIKGAIAKQRAGSFRPLMISIFSTEFFTEGARNERKEKKKVPVKPWG